MAALVGRPFPSKGGFDACLEGHLVVNEVDGGNAASGALPRTVATLVVTDTLANAYGTLHGGAVATLVRSLSVLRGWVRGVKLSVLYDLREHVCGMCCLVLFACECSMRSVASPFCTTNY
jgi:hypothetical protein